MKNLLLIAFATVALFMGANIANACPTCEGKQVVKTDKADKADVNTDAVADAKETTKTAVKSGCASAKKASAGQLVRADRGTVVTNRSAAGQADGDCCGGCCTKAEDGKGDCCGGCCNKKADCEGKDCGSGCAKKGECGGCDSKKSEKAAKN